MCSLQVTCRPRYVVCQEWNLLGENAKLLVRKGLLTG